MHPALGDLALLRRPGKSGDPGGPAAYGTCAWKVFLSRFEDPASVRDALERLELEVELLTRADSYA